MKIDHEKAKGLLEDFCKDKPGEDITVLQTEKNGRNLVFRRVPLEAFDPETTEGLVDAFIESIGSLNEGAEALHEKQLLEMYSKRKLKAPVSLGIIINSQEEDEEVEVVDKKQAMIIKAIVGAPPPSKNLVSQPQLNFKKAPGAPPPTPTPPKPAPLLMSGEEVQKIYHKQPKKPPPTKMTIGNSRSWRPGWNPDQSWKQAPPPPPPKHRGGGIVIKSINTKQSQAQPPRGGKR